jgi:hypothetical protein
MVEGEERRQGLQDYWDEAGSVSLGERPTYFY